MLSCRDDGKISKTLSLQRFDQGGDWFLQLSVQDSANKDGSMKIGLPITGSELFTLKTLAEVNIPLCCHHMPGIGLQSLASVTVL